MANIKSQIKRIKQNEKRHQRNKAVKSGLKTAVRKFREAADAGEKDQAISLGTERMIALPLREAREVFEREYLNAQMLRFSGNISRTAAFIGMERSALHRKLKSLGLSGARAVEEEEVA